jgi:poly(3-hydroxyalkanoate) synthetase
MAVDAYCRLLDRAALSPADRSGGGPPWTTPNRVALELSSMRLRDFSQTGAGPPVLVCAPYALHGARIADFAPRHSIVETLRHEGLDRVHVTDWHSATSEMRHFGIDAYLSDLNVAVDEIGAPVDLVGLCQGGWLSLIYAARFPHKVRRLVLAGAPVDMSVPSELSRNVAQTPQQAFEGMVTPGRGVISGEYMLSVWTRSFSAPEVGAVLQRDVSAENELLDRFRRWDNAPLDLPGAYFLQVVSWIFRENRLAGGGFVALGKGIRLTEVKTPVFLLAGASDEVVPAEQAFATAPLLGAPPVRMERAAECSRHLSLFMGCQTLSDSWSRVAHWLKGDAADLDSAA